MAKLTQREFINILNRMGSDIAAMCEYIQDDDRFSMNTAMSAFKIKSEFIELKQNFQKIMQEN